MTVTIFPASIDCLAGFLEHMAECAREKGFGLKKIGAMKLATEEVLVNIFKYAYPEKAGEVEMRCFSGEDNRFIIEISDGGVPFNPLEISEPDLTAEVAEREIGGLGIFMVRRLVDKIEYRRENNKNIISLINDQP